VTRPAKISGSLGLALALSLVFVIVAGILPQITALFGEASKVLATGL
jgi:hypothetical protein